MVMVTALAGVARAARGFGTVLGAVLMVVAAFATAPVALADRAQGVAKIAVGASNGGSAGSAGWAPVAPLPFPDLPAAVSAAGHIFAVGVGGLHSYDPGSDQWTQLAPPPTSRGALAVAAVDGTVLAMGGLTTADPTCPRASAAVEAYSIAKNSWRQLPPLPTARWHAAAAVGDDGRVYVIGGRAPNPFAPPCGRADDQATNVVEAFDPQTQSWSAVAPLPAAIAEAAAVTGPDGRIYVIGGIQNHALEPTTAVEVYDPATNSWSKAEPMPTARFNLSAVLLGGRIEAIGGLGIFRNEYLPNVDVYDPGTDRWSAGTSLPFGRGYSSAAVIGSDAYVVGGVTGDAEGSVSTTASVLRLQAVQPVQAPPPDDWAQSGGGAAHTDSNPAETVLTPTTIGGLSPAWSAQVSGEIRDQQSVGNGILYTAASLPGSVLATDEVTGEFLWERDFGSGFVHTPAYMDGVVYVTTQQCGNCPDQRSTIYALDADTGQTLWTYQTPWPQEFPATVADGVVYFSADSFDSGQAAVYALDAGTGAQLWSMPLPNALAFGAISVASGAAYFVTTGGNIPPVLHAADAATGAVRWTHAYSGSPNIGGLTPIVDQGKLFFVDDIPGAGRSVVALSASTGAQIWQQPCVEVPGLGGPDPACSGTMAVAGGLVVLGGLKAEALSEADGTLRWTSGPSATIGMAIAGGVVYGVGDASSFRMSMLDLATGQQVGSIPGNSFTANPVIANGFLFLGQLNASFTNSNGTFTAYTIESNQAALPRVAASASGLAFGTVPVGGTAGQALTLTNTGSGDMLPPAFSFTGPAASAFSVSDNRCDGTTLPRNSIFLQTNTCQVTVSFTPRASGPQTASLVISIPGVLPPVTIQLAGAGLGGPFAGLPAAHVFAATAVGSTGSAVVSLANGGNADMWVQDLAIGGANPGDFTVSGPATPFTIKPGKSVPLTVGFAPATTGLRRAVLRVTYNGASSPQSVDLGGNGQTPGTARAWGYGIQGQLGGGGLFVNYQPTPSPVTAVPPLDALSPGGFHGLGLDASGTVWSWGQNIDGELGNGTISPFTECCSNTPAPVPGLSGVVSVAAGSNFSLAARSDGSVWAWGADDVGQLGDGGMVSRATPQQVPGLSGIVAVAADPNWLSSYALSSDGTVWAWGSNFHGQLGDGSLTDRRTPVQVKGLTDVVALSAAETHVLALRADGSVWSWGENGVGELGRGLAADRAPLAGPVPGLSDIVAVAAGGGFSLALDSSGHVWAWGFNSFGELGDGTTTNQLAPERLAIPANVIAIGAGRGTGYAVTAAGALYSWGSNEFGELGDGSVNSPPQLTPELITTLTGVFAVWGGNNDTYALSAP